MKKKNCQAKKLQKKKKKKNIEPNQNFSDS